ncbi:FAD-dependent oxidoreductase [Telmatospirillum sp. J64-1]|uniref:FAD-dependent oxidoreductase n=1 Tax=Telmatospirillum sp. J64-1 TaxID=2502183 RepID=UPI00115EDF56|nr:FAD-dependent oxidoreductase [Telmatospirillum sp. J64-1]
MTEKFDAIVVGAGPSGNAAAYTLAKAGLNVLQLERGEYAGSKNVQGAILYADALERIIPDFREDAPLERHIIEQRMWCMDEKSYMGAHYRSDEFNEEKPNRYTIIRAQFDKWFSEKVRGAGALVICETTVTELIKDGERVVGVRTDREQGDIFADVVVLADGVNSLLARKAGFHPEISGKNVALAVKEMHFLPQEVIESRFNIGENEGVVIEMMGKVTRGMVGTGFLYTNRESIAIGIGCMVDDFKHGGVTPYGLLEELKAHPSVAPLIKGAEVKEYAAHLIPEGGYKAVPRISGEGWMIVGDSGMFVNAVHREGSNLAMTTGRIAAETVIALKERGLDMNAANLSAYRKALDDSFVMKDLKKYKDMPDFLHGNKHFFTKYPDLLAKAASTMLRVDGIDKLSKEKQISRSFRQSRSLFGLVGDAVKLVRAFR